MSEDLSFSLLFKDSLGLASPSHCKSDRGVDINLTSSGGSFTQV